MSRVVWYKGETGNAEDIDGCVFPPMVAKGFWYAAKSQLVSSDISVYTWKTSWRKAIAILLATWSLVYEAVSEKNKAMSDEPTSTTTIDNAGVVEKKASFSIASILKDAPSSVTKNPSKSQG